MEVREIFRKGLQSKASALILAHNHPSGKAEATDQDCEFTEKLIELGEKLGLDVLDHDVVGKSVQIMRGTLNSGSTTFRIFAAFL